MAEKKKAEIGALGTIPVTILWEKILLLSITGIIDSRRAQEIMETVLDEISRTAGKMLILDIFGVATVDSAVANHLIKITKATQQRDVLA